VDPTSDLTADEDCYTLCPATQLLQVRGKILFFSEQAMTGLLAGWPRGRFYFKDEPPPQRSASLRNVSPI